MHRSLCICQETVGHAMAQPRVTQEHLMLPDDDPRVVAHLEHFEDEVYRGTKEPPNRVGCLLLITYAVLVPSNRSLVEFTV